MFRSWASAALAAAVFARRFEGPERGEGVIKGCHVFRSECLTGSLKDLVIHFDAHLEARELSAVRLHALELDVIEKLVQEHHGPLLWLD